MGTRGSGLTYRGAGVDIDAGDTLVERIKPHVRRTLRPEVMTDLGGFAGLCALPARYKEPLLVSCTDGVGTKLKLAFLTGRHDTVGIDLVAMNVNDMIVCGAEPLLFLDYFASGKLDVGVAERVIAGIADGCQAAGCALIGGETAELPGFYADGEYDLAGFSVGVVEKSRRVDGRAIRAGDRLLGLASSGFHSNGYSLVRRVFLDHMKLPLDAAPPGLGEPLAAALLRPTRIYVRALRALHDADLLRGAAHITGGGLVDNPTRMLPPDARLQLRINLGSWPVPPIFGLLAEASGAGVDAFRETFNLGIGMVLVVPVDASDQVIQHSERAGVPAFAIGRVEEGGPIRFG